MKTYIIKEEYDGKIRKPQGGYYRAGDDVPEQIAVHVPQMVRGVNRPVVIETPTNDEGPALGQTRDEGPESGDAGQATSDEGPATGDETPETTEATAATKPPSRRKRGG